MTRHLAGCKQLGAERSCSNAVQQRGVWESPSCNETWRDGRNGGNGLLEVVVPPLAQPCAGGCARRRWGAWLPGVQKRVGGLTDACQSRGIVGRNTNGSSGSVPCYAMEETLGK